MQTRSIVRDDRQTVVAEKPVACGCHLERGTALARKRLAQHDGDCGVVARPDRSAGRMQTDHFGPPRDIGGNQGARQTVCGIEFVIEGQGISARPVEKDRHPAILALDKIDIGRGRAIGRPAGKAHRPSADKNGQVRQDKLGIAHHDRRLFGSERP